jgi:TRAP-type uncharacterized transport system substrate-binding protein
MSHRGKWLGTGHWRYPLSILLISLFLTVVSAAGSFASDQVWRMGSSSAGTAGYACTIGLTSLISKYTPDVKIEAMPTPGSTPSLRLFAR